jgi:RNA polymerase sigma-70 factor (ECF subfamily)
VDNEAEARVHESPPTRRPAALEALIEEYQQHVGGYLIHLIGDQQVALALAEEMFVDAHRARVADRPDTAIGPWLYRRATRLAYRHLRGRSHRFPRRAVEWATSGRESSQIAEARMVESALRDLQPGERAVLLLCDLEQLPVVEAAAILGMSSERLQQRLARARARFRLAFLAHHAVATAW